MASPTTSPGESAEIDRNAFLGVLGTFSGIAIISASIRIIIRLRLLKGVRVDDYFFLAAVIMKVVADGLLFASYTHQPRSAYSFATKQAQVNQAFIQHLGNQLTFATFNEVLDWSTIFLIKLCFLFYFRGLVDRLFKFQVWWWMTLGLLLPTTILMICAPFIVCPHFGASMIVECAGPSFLERERAILYYSVASDIVTDLQLMSIPMLILRKIKLDIRRKFTIAMITCLSLFMIAIALVRVISFNIVGSWDQWWITFWVHLEASVSIIAACPIAYRNLFAVKNRKEKMSRQINGDRPRRSVLEAVWKRTRPVLPSIGFSGAEMTGMSTALRGDDERSQTDSRTEDGIPVSFPTDRNNPEASSETQRLSIQDDEAAIGQAV